MKEMMFILLVAFLATWVVLPPEAPLLISGAGAALPDIDQVAGAAPAGAANCPVFGWLLGQLWGAVYALESI